MQLQGQLLQLNLKVKREDYKQNLLRVRPAAFSSVLHVQAPVRLQTQQELRGSLCGTGYNKQQHVPTYFCNQS